MTRRFLSNQLDAEVLDGVLKNMEIYNDSDKFDVEVLPYLQQSALVADVCVLSSEHAAGCGPHGARQLPAAAVDVAAAPHEASVDVDEGEELSRLGLQGVTVVAQVGRVSDEPRVGVADAGAQGRHPVEKRADLRR